ncbi:MAG: hypothetical protein WCD86_17235 [Ktedonobacteraceae bacterium]
MGHHRACEEGLRWQRGQKPTKEPETDGPLPVDARHEGFVVGKQGELAVIPCDRDAEIQRLPDLLRQERARHGAAPQPLRQERARGLLARGRKVIESRPQKPGARSKIAH